MAESADASDLKSDGLVPCGFESHYPYSLSEILNRDKISIVNVHEPVLQSFEGHILKQKGNYAK